MKIFLTTNLLNGKWYIGKQENNDPNYLGSGKLIKRAIRKHGVENFKKEILEECDACNINIKERYWIKKLNAVNDKNSYNLALGGEGGDTFSGSYHNGDIEWQNYLKTIRSRKGQNNPMYGKRGKNHPKFQFKESEETRLKKAEIRKGSKLSAETKEKIGLKTRERVKNLEFIEKLKISIKKGMTEEVKKKISDRRRESNCYGERHHRSRKVSIKGTIYGSIADAIRSNSIGIKDRGTVIKRLRDPNITDWFYI
jgi:hypothetical protein